MDVVLFIHLLCDQLYGLPPYFFINQGKRKVILFDFEQTLLGGNLRVLSHFL
jgi:hypothetical protein